MGVRDVFSASWMPYSAKKGQKVPCILSRLTLRFQSKEFERLYMEHHWANMSYWLWRSVLVGILYLVAAAAFGADAISQVFDVRMDHYTKSAWVDSESNSPGMAGVNGTVPSNEKWVRVISAGEHQEVLIPRSGFIIWHATWCFFFLIILLVDRFKHRLVYNTRTWVLVRPWLAFGVMFVDLVMCSFLNPSVSRFMTFVYAILVRAQFMQTLSLVFISSLAMFGAGLVGTHSFLNSVSVAEFVILNFVCLLASRQTEIHARLSLYRLWYIVTKDKESRSAFHGDISETNIARHLLSLEELRLTPIPENDMLQHDELENFTDGDIEQGDIAAAMQEQEACSDDESNASPYKSGARSPIVPGTPRSDHSGGSRSNNSLSGRIKRALSGEIRKPSKHGASTEYEDATSEVGSYISEMSLNPMNLPPWYALEGTDNFKRSETGDFEDACKWSEVSDVERYSLRGKSYITDKQKAPASSAAFAVHQARLFKTKLPLYNVAGRLPSLRAFIQSHPKQFFFVYNRIVPYKNGTIMNVVTLMVRKLPKGEDPAFDNLFDGFLTGTEEFRNSRLKHLSSMRLAPSVVSNAIWLLGGEKPVIIGKGYMEQKQYVGKNYIEIDVDITPSRAARMVVGKVVDHAASVIMEEMLVLEGHSPEELPERPLFAWRWLKINPDACIIELDESILNDADEAASAPAKSAILAAPSPTRANEAAQQMKQAPALTSPDGPVVKLLALPEIGCPMAAEREPNGPTAAEAAALQALEAAALEAMEVAARERQRQMLPRSL